MEPAQASRIHVGMLPYMSGNGCRSFHHDARVLHLLPVAAILNAAKAIPQDDGELSTPREPASF
jgi:hypothetical protein